MDISMDIHRKRVDMDMDMDGKFHIHGKPDDITQQHVLCNVAVSNISVLLFFLFSKCHSISSITCVGCTIQFYISV